MAYTYDYPRPMVTVDIILTTQKHPSEILLIQRKNPPFENTWALPGGFVDMDEDLKDAAIRELKEETGVDYPDLKQFKTYGTPQRDPRGRTISIVFYASTPNKIDAIGMDDAAEAAWFPLEQLPPLAFDHQVILEEFINYSSSS